MTTYTCGYIVSKNDEVIFECTRSCFGEFNMCETHLMPIPIMTAVADEKSSNTEMAKKWMRWYLKCEECSTESDWPETNIKITKTAEKH